MTSERPDLARRAGAKGLAAFALVFAGCGAAITNAECHGALGQVGVALTFGLVIMVMVYSTGHLSGAHVNPAVTIAFTLTRHFPAREAAAYVGAQAAGALAGALALLAVWPDQPAQLGATVPSVGTGSALVYELVLTAILMFVIMAVATDTRAVGAGTIRAELVHPEVVEAMLELGVDLSGRVPQRLTEELASRADVVVTMGCGDECPYVPGKRYVDWDLDDPAGRPLPEVRRIRDDVATRTEALAAELG